jgi:hypothetical protein
MADEYEKIKKQLFSQSELLKLLKPYEMPASISSASEVSKQLEALSKFGLASTAIKDVFAQTHELSSQFEALARQAHQSANNYDQLIPKQSGLKSLLEAETNRLQESQRLFNQLTKSRAAYGPFNDIQEIIERNHARFEIPQPIEWPTIPKALDFGFRIPSIVERAGLAAAALESTPGLALERQDKLLASMERLGTPWAAVGAELASTKAFDRLLEIGSLTSASFAFTDEASAKLRAFLGDWRDVGIPVGIEHDLNVRTELYESLGLDVALTTLPNAAFDREVEIAELDAPDPELIVIYDAPIPARDEEQESEFRRTNDAHNRLLRFETHLRAFLDAVMTEKFGADWHQKRLDDDTRQKWEEKRQRAEDQGAKPLPLIAYADFTDYERVILRKENWKEIFQGTFVRRESVQESLLRLYPVRLCTMHARTITQDDQLYLYAETRRILNAIATVSTTLAVKKS